MIQTCLLLALTGLGPVEPIGPVELAGPVEIPLLDPASPMLDPASPLFSSLTAPLVDDDEGGSPFSYTYLEFGAVEYDVDAAGEEADIYYLEGSLELGMFHVLANYQNTDIGFGDTTSDLFSIGAGAHFNMTDKLDLFGDVSWLFQSVDSNLANLDDSTDGYMIRAGPRWMPIDWDGGGLELNGQVLWVDLENRIASEDEAFGWGVGGQLHFLRLMSFGLEYAVLEDDDQVSANLRLSL